MALVQLFWNPVSRFVGSIFILFGTVAITHGLSGLVGSDELHVEWEENRYVLPGAQMIKKADRPFQVMVTETLAGTNGYTVIGSGAIYNDKWLIIAAHMLFDETGKSRFYRDLKFMVGKRDMTDHEAGEEVFTAQDILMHPDYKPSQMGNDIALVNLKSEIAYTDTIKQIPIAGSAPSGQVSASGWAYSEHGKIDLQKPRHRSKSKYMQIQEQSIVTLEECIKNYTEFEVTSVFKIPPAGRKLWRFKESWPVPTNTTLCTVTSSTKDVCLGESGSPLTCSGGELCGILSHGIGCSLANLPSIYTDISQFSAWIQKVAGNADGSSSTADSNSGSTGDGQNPTDTGDEGTAGPDLIPINPVTSKPLMDGKNCTKSPDQPEIDEPINNEASAIESGSIRPTAKSENMVDSPDTRSVRESRAKNQIRRSYYPNIKPGRTYRIVDGRITREWDAPKNKPKPGRLLRVEKPHEQIPSQSVHNRASQKFLEVKNSRRRFEGGPVGNNPRYATGQRYTMKH